MAPHLTGSMLRVVVLGLLALQALAVGALWAWAEVVDRRLAAAAATQRVLAGELQLSDLALFSEASYCRHPTGADLFAAHADHPAALEHFPAGSVVPPPRSRLALPEGPGDAQ